MWRDGAYGYYKCNYESSIVSVILRPWLLARAGIEPRSPALKSGALPTEVVVSNSNENLRFETGVNAKNAKSRESDQKSNITANLKILRTQTIHRFVAQLVFLLPSINDNQSAPLIFVTGGNEAPNSKCAIKNYWVWRMLRIAVMTSVFNICFLKQSKGHVLDVLKIKQNTGFPKISRPASTWNHCLISCREWLGRIALYWVNQQ